MGMMQNNPFFQMINAVRNGQNPMPILNQNPQWQQRMGCLNGKNESQIIEMINSEAQQRGIDLSQLLLQIGAPQSVAEKLGIKQS